MATIRKLTSGRFQAIVRRKPFPPSFKTFSTAKAARTWAISREAKLELLPTHVKEGWSVGSPSSIDYLEPMLADYIEAFLLKTRPKDTSMVGRLRAWSHHFANRSLTSIEPEEIDTFLLQLAQRVSGSTVNRYRSNLSSVYRSALRDPILRKLIRTNPVLDQRVSKFKENPSKERFLNPEEQNRLLEEANHASWDRLHLLVLLALSTGARKSELLGLRWSDIDTDRRVGYLPETKSGRPRLLPLVEEAVSELHRLRGRPTELIFASKLNPSKPLDIKKSWSNLLSRCGIDNLRFHDLRHTTASNLIANGKTLIETGILLGHSQPSTTMRYAHLSHQHTSHMASEVWSKIRK